MRVSFDEFEFDRDRFELRRNNVPVPVEPQVFDVLAFLIDHRDRVVTKEELLDGVWGDRFVSESALTSRIKAVRQALGDDGSSQRLVQTVRGRGYRFVASVTEAEPDDPPSSQPTHEPTANEPTVEDTPSWRLSRSSSSMSRTALSSGPPTARQWQPAFSSMTGSSRTRRYRTPGSSSTRQATLVASRSRVPQMPSTRPSTCNIPTGR